MVRILSIEDCKGVFIGYIEDSKVYRRFEVTPQETRFTAEYPKSEYGEYEHFAAILGKFDPHTRFFKEPKEVAKLDYQGLEALTREE